MPLSQGSDDITRAVISFSSNINFSDGLKVYDVKVNNTGLQRKPYITFNGDLSVCDGETVKLTAKPYAGDNITWQWYKNNNPVANANDKQYVATTEGRYFVRINDAGNCSNISDEVNIVQGNCFAGNADENNSLQAYPNPFITSTNLNLKNNISGRLTVSDKTGNVIQVLNVSGSNSIKLLETAKPGMYFIKIITTDGFIYTAKVMKQ